MKKKLIPKINRGILSLRNLNFPFFNAFPFKKLYSTPKYVNKIALGACILKKKNSPYGKVYLKIDQIFLFLWEIMFMVMIELQEN